MLDDTDLDSRQPVDDQSRKVMPRLGHHGMGFLQVLGLRGVGGSVWG